MAILKIPERVQPGIAKLASLPSASFTHLLTALRDAPECNDAVELSTWIGEQLPEVSRGDRHLIISAITSMANVQFDNNVKPQHFAEDVWDSMSVYSPESIEGIDAEEARKRFEEVVSIPRLSIPEDKAADLKGEVERSYCEARILTDLRAGFRKSADDSPSLMVLLHNLRIAYHDDTGKHREFYVTLDENDLNALQRTIERARRKSVALKAAMDKAQVRIVG